MRKRGYLLGVFTGLVAIGCGTSPPVGAPAQPAPVASAPPARSPPYVEGGIPLLDLLPPAPAPGDARDAADRRIFRDTRQLADTPRWQMAALDAELGPAAMLQHFACSLDMELTPQQVPRLVALLQKGTREAAQSVGRAKDFYKRPRPFLVDEGAICVARTTVGDSFDYPSGHTTAGWAWALMLAQADPQHAPGILARGRAIGDSRVICGVHNASAVEGARLLAGAAMSVVSSSERYQADLLDARTEIAALRSGAHARPDPARCAVEAEMVKAYW